LGGDDLNALAAEQAALRRIAARVASGAPPEAVFAAVLEQVGRLLARRRIVYAGIPLIEARA
jgi:hypothetical protein